MYQVLIHLDISKACGPDILSPHRLKEAASVISPSLAGLFNKTIQDGSLPEDWVSANIAPVFKRGDKHLISNYRPISLTSIVSKVLERLIHHKLYSFLEQQEVISHTQFGFHKRRSTVHLLLSAVDDWVRTLNQCGSTHCLFLDFSKAFDTVPHQRLLLKLQHYGVEGCLLNWFRAFLMHRRQRIVINGCASHWTPVLSGVSQGSILGPLLFALYMNDLPCSLTSCVKMFADDVALYYNVWQERDCLTLQNDLNAIASWCALWQMKLNPSKCEALCISNKRSPPLFHYTYGDHVIKWTDAVHYLGVTFNTHLSWNHHCKSVASKATRCFNVLRHTMFGCSNKAKSIAFSALVFQFLNMRLQYGLHTVRKHQLTGITPSPWGSLDL